MGCSGGPGCRCGRGGEDQWQVRCREPHVRRAPCCRESAGFLDCCPGWNMEKLTCMPEYITYSGPDLALRF